MLEFFQAIENAGFAQVIKNSTWAFAVIESIHLLALAVMGGAVLLVDFRMLGLGLTNRPVKELAHEMSKYVTLSLVVLIVTGLGLFVTEATKCFYSTPFWVKMVTLAIATVFTFTVRRGTVNQLTMDVTGAAKGIALVSVALWFVVAASGRWIGFSG